MEKRYKINDSSGKIPFGRRKIARALGYDAFVDKNEFYDYTAETSDEGPSRILVNQGARLSDILALFGANRLDIRSSDLDGNSKHLEQLGWHYDSNRSKAIDAKRRVA